MLKSKKNSAKNIFLLLQKVQNLSLKLVISVAAFGSNIFLIWCGIEWDQVWIFSSGFWGAGLSPFNLVVIANLLEIGVFVSSVLTTAVQLY